MLENYRLPLQLQEAMGNMETGYSTAVVCGLPGHVDECLPLDPGNNPPKHNDPGCYNLSNRERFVRRRIKINRLKTVQI